MARHDCRIVSIEKGSFGLVLARFRQARGLSQAAVARRLGTTPQYVGMIERGERRPRRAKVDELCKAIGVDPAEQDFLIGLWSRSLGPGLPLPPASGALTVSGLELRLQAALKGMRPRERERVERLMVAIADLVQRDRRMLLITETIVVRLEARIARRPGAKERRAAMRLLKAPPRRSRRE